MSQLQSQLQNLPGYDVAMDYWNEYAEEHINKKIGRNPYEDEDGHKLKLKNPHSTDQEKRLWKRVQKQAWVHDKCFLGSCWVGLDCGVGLVPVVVALVPALGPLLMYGVHARLVHIVTNEYTLPNTLVAKLEAQILFDLLISLPPVIGGFFSWLNGCLTRNAGMIYDYFLFAAEQRATNKVPVYVGTGGASAPPPAATRPARHADLPRANNYNRSDNSHKPLSRPFYPTRKPPPSALPSSKVVVQQEQQSGFI